MGFTHKELCDLAVKWLKRPNSSNGHGCHVAVSEVATGFSGEIPDAIGFRYAGYQKSDGSVLVEVKTSRSDFLADKKKPHRISGGIGTWRYFMAPQGLIKVDELPEKWGLIEVNVRGHIKVICGPASVAGNWGRFDDELAAFRHEADMAREQFLLTKLFKRVGDVEQLNKNLKEAWSERNKLVEQVNRLHMKLRVLEQKNLVRYAKALEANP